MRLITRCDSDGMACAVLLEEMGVVEKYKFVHPKIVQDGHIKVNDNDVLANIPYAPGCGMWFDHHSTAIEHMKQENFEFDGACRPAPSTAQVIWDYYKGDNKFDSRYRLMLDAVNRFDSGTLTREDVINPQGWILICFLLDPRTGLGRFDDFRINSLRFVENTIRYARRMKIEEILKIPDVQARVKRYFDQQEAFIQMIEKCSEVRDNCIVINLLNEENISPGNRFLSYVLYPKQNIEIRLMGTNKKNVVLSCGHSIFNRSSRTNVGSLMEKYGGGGHIKVGTCQIAADRWEKVLEEIVEQIQKDG
ncbi:exopolyphosphatase [Desulfobacterales bacterium HSG16]|nr:exopolyphosphatase [Desulfobacterales bacterium HSG16]